MENQNINSRISFLSNLAKAPIELQLYIAFCLIISILGLVTHFALPKEIAGRIIPFTGWSMGLLYFFNLIITFVGMTNLHSRMGALTIQYGNLVLLAIILLFGIIDLVNYDVGYIGNPYLSHSPIRWIWTIAIPATWVLVMLSPRINNFSQSLSVKEP